MTRTPIQNTVGGYLIPSHPAALVIYLIISAAGMILLSFAILFQTGVLEYSINADYKGAFIVLFILLPISMIVPITSMIAAQIFTKAPGKDWGRAFNKLWGLGVLWAFSVLFGSLGIISLAQMFLRTVIVKLSGVMFVSALATVLGCAIYLAICVIAKRRLQIGVKS